MTKKEAIETLESVIETLEMAIKVLKRETCGDEDSENVYKIYKDKESEEEAIEVFRDCINHEGTYPSAKVMSTAINALSAISDIKAEITEEMNKQGRASHSVAHGLWIALDIIDKYIGEME